jgi:hypothetical protein
LEQLTKEFTDFCKHLYDYWHAENLWTWRWWVLAVLTVAPWGLWFLIRKKESTGRLLCVAFFVSVVAIFLDIIGGGFELWAYTVRVIPIISSFIPWDISVMPVATMLFLQFFPKVNLFIKAGVYAFSGAFICEPVAVWLEIASEPHWSSFYSFPIILIIYLLSHAIFTSKSFKVIK